MNGSAIQNATNTVQAPEKDWCDINADEKIERMRRMVKLTMDSQERINARVYKIEKLLRDHQHGLNGTVLMGIREAMEESFYKEKNDSILEITGKVFF